MSKHLIFFDGDCALCHKLITYLITIDPEKKLSFAPLEGRTAQEILIGPNAHYAREETLVLVEDFLEVMVRDAEHHVRIHGDEAPIAVIGEALVAGFFRERRHDRRNPDVRRIRPRQGAFRVDQADRQAKHGSVCAGRRYAGAGCRGCRLIGSWFNGSMVRKDEAFSSTANREP